MKPFANGLIQAPADHPQSAAGSSTLLLVTGLSEIAGAMKGVGGDKQLRLYVTRASAAQEVLAPADEFCRDKDNTVFASIATIFARAAGTPTLQFSSAEWLVIGHWRKSKVAALTLTGQGSEAWQLVEHFPQLVHKTNQRYEPGQRELEGASRVRMLVLRAERANALALVDAALRANPGLTLFGVLPRLRQR